MQIVQVTAICLQYPDQRVGGDGITPRATQGPTRKILAPQAPTEGLIGAWPWVPCLRRWAFLPPGGLRFAVSGGCGATAGQS